VEGLISLVDCWPCSKPKKKRQRQNKLKKKEQRRRREDKERELDSDGDGDGDGDGVFLLFNESSVIVPLQYRIKSTRYKQFPQ